MNENPRCPRISLLRIIRLGELDQIGAEESLQVTSK